MLPLALACALSVLAACTPDTTDPLIEAGEDLLEAFDPNADPDDGFGALNRLAAEQPDLAADVARGLLDAEEANTRYAAVYVLALTAEAPDEVEALRSALDADEAHLRAVAGGSLIGLGEAAAIPALIELLTATDEIPGSKPSTFVDRFSSVALTTYTGEDFGVLEAGGSRARQEAQQRWRDWFESVRESLRWDPEARRYEA
jgi:hypothetical protein